MLLWLCCTWKNEAVGPWKLFCVEVVNKDASVSRTMLLLCCIVNITLIELPQSYYKGRLCTSYGFQKALQNSNLTVSAKLCLPFHLRIKFGADFAVLFQKPFLQNGASWMNLIQKCGTNFLNPGFCFFFAPTSSGKEVFWGPGTLDPSSKLQ